MPIRTRRLRFMHVLPWLAMLSTGCQEDPIARARSMISDVSKAIDKPNGEVRAAVISDVLEASRAQGAASMANGFVPGAVPPGTAQAIDGVPGQECISGSDDTYTMDMGCLTNDKITGSLVYTVDVDGTTSIMHMTYDNVCIPEQDTCIQGEAAIETRTSATGSSFVTAGELTVTAAGESMTLSYGYRMEVSSSGDITIEYLVNVDGNSYVLTASVSGDSGEFTIRGANGSFTCMYTDGGAAGSCSGDGEFDWG